MLEQLRARLRALLNQRQAHQETLDQILATCEAEGRSAFSADEDTTWAETRSAIDTIDAERGPVEERIAELETALAAMTVERDARDVAIGVLAGEVRWWNYYHSDHDEICAAKVARKNNAFARAAVEGEKA